MVELSQGAWVLVAALLLATGFGLWRAARDGRFRGTHAVRGVSTGGEAGSTGGGPGVSTLRQAQDGASSTAGEGSAGGEAGSAGGEWTLLQFSSAFCAPCRSTRRVLDEVARIVPRVVHVEIDAEHHLELVRRHGVARTPTTLVLDAEGREVTRAVGAPTRDEVLATLDKAMDGGK